MAQEARAVADPVRQLPAPCLIPSVLLRSTQAHGIYHTHDGTPNPAGFSTPYPELVPHTLLGSASPDSLTLRVHAGRGLLSALLSAATLLKMLRGVRRQGRPRSLPEVVPLSGGLPAGCPRCWWACHRARRAPAPTLVFGCLAACNTATVSRGAEGVWLSICIPISSRTGLRTQGRPFSVSNQAAGRAASREASCSYTTSAASRQSQLQAACETVPGHGAEWCRGRGVGGMTRVKSQSQG
eukprot:223468-Chlamydomonas_euryale.AAC.1